VTPRAQLLRDTVDHQIAELAECLSAADDAALAGACPGREKLGDGSVGAVAAHTIVNYQRIAGFVAGDSGVDPPHPHDTPPALPLGVLLARLTAAREALATIAQLSDEELDAVPPSGDMRFADGARTLEQILASLLRHQRHQVDALAAALA
jgi:hypothetical protein